MKPNSLPALIFAVGALQFLASLSTQAQPTPLIHAHAHNDYEHARPLFDALDHGFCSVEADIYLVDGQLLVAHDRNKVKPERTLQALYLDPLRERVKKNGGQVYPGTTDFTLLIDVKSDAEKTYAVLRDVLKQYADLLTVFRPEATESKAITAIISGNRARNVMAAEMLRYAALDGRLPDLDGNIPKHLIPLVSDNWQNAFKWRGTGPMPDDEKQKLEQIVARAHQQGRRVRFWATPDQPDFWRELQSAGVDLLNVDDLAGLQRFFNQK
jgi:glycerophosphoryl diester phosphodiesterase